MDIKERYTFIDEPGHPQNASPCKTTCSSKAYWFALRTVPLQSNSTQAGRLELADEWCAKALNHAQRRGDHLTAAGALKIRAAIERQRGALDMSIAALRLAIHEVESAEDPLLHAELLRELGEVSRAVGNAGAARSAWREAVDSFQLVGASREVADVRAEIHSLPG
jgi:tetratricopeptide (TPR) repeat protein